MEIGTRAKGDSDEVGRARLGLVPGIGRELHAERRVHRIGDTHEAGRTRLGLNPGGAHDGMAWSGTSSRSCETKKDGRDWRKETCVKRQGLVWD